MRTASFVALPERFCRLESMLFAPQPGQAHRAAEVYVGHLLSSPVAPPVIVRTPFIPAPVLPEPAGLADLDV